LFSEEAEEGGYLSDDTKEELKMKRFETPASCIHLRDRPHLVILNIIDNVFWIEKIHFTVRNSRKLFSPDKATDEVGIAMENFGNFSCGVKPVFKLNHWIPRIFLMRFLVLNWSRPIFPRTISEDQPLVFLTSVAISVWLNPPAEHQDMNFLISSRSELSVIRLYNISKSLICQVFSELFLKYFLAQKSALQNNFIYIEFIGFMEGVSIGDIVSPFEISSGFENSS